MKVSLFLSTLLLAIWLPMAGSAQQWTKGIDSLLSTTNPRIFNGVVLITKDGQPIYHACHGYRSLAKKTPLHLTDQFLVGSITKQFTATLILQQVQAGRISPNHTIRHYLPHMPQAWADSVTVQQLLNHTSGITHWSKPLAHPPGSKFLYNNINYALLGKITEHITGRSYATQAATLFAACGMKTATIADTSKKRYKKLVKGHPEADSSTYTEQSILHLLDAPVMGLAAAGAIATATDLAQWMQCLHNGKLLADSTYHAMTTHSATRTHRWGPIQYADGIQVNNDGGITEYSMSGYVPGFIATMIYYPKTRISMVVLENISPSSANMNRAFFFHDQIRNIVRGL